MAAEGPDPAPTQAMSLFSMGPGIDRNKFHQIKRKTQVWNFPALKASIRIDKNENTESLQQKIKTV